jgi:putative phosphoribosyl transferase
MTTHGDLATDQLLFHDRAQAGRALAARLGPLIPPPCVVAGIPRGGVVVALPVAERLHAPLTVAYARKLAAPLAPELAFGAMDEDGEAILDVATMRVFRLGPADLAEARETVRREIERRIALYQAPPLAAFLPGSVVVLVDDGLATGLTMRAALDYARRHGAREVTVAAPCASAEAAARFQREADRFVSLIVDPGFQAVGQYYAVFSQVSDQEVLAMLRRTRTPARPEPSDPGLRLQFKNTRGSSLTGHLSLPASPPPHPAVAFAHGLGSSKDSPRNRTIAEALRAAGFAAFLFDFTGHGESEGTPETSTLGQQVDDLGAALDVLESLDDVDPARIAVVGASSGAAVALVRAATDPRVRALVLRSGNPEGAEAVLDRVRVPTLLVVGEHDAPILEANQALLARLSGPRRLYVVPGGDHLFQDPAALRRAGAAAVAWLREHLR